MDELLKQLSARNFEVKPDFSGHFHRFTRLGGSEEKPNGWFIGREVEVDGQQIMVAHYGDFRTKEKYQWTSQDGKKLDPAEAKRVKEALKRAEEANRKERDSLQQQTAELCNTNLPYCITEGNSPYLVRKGVGGSLYGCVLDPDDPTVLIVTLEDIEGRLWSVQKVFGDGRKRYLKGGRKKGLFHPIRSTTPGGPILICEGIATAASLHLATGCTVLAALDAENLDDVATALRTRYPEAVIRICGDNDLWTTDNGKPGGKPINPGQDAARAAMRAAGGSTACTWPGFTSAQLASKPTDFNDLHALSGLEAVKTQVWATSLVDSAALYSLAGPAPVATPTTAPDTSQATSPPADRQEEGPTDAFTPAVFRDADGNRRLPYEMELARLMLAHFGSDLVKQDRELFRYEEGYWKRLQTRELDAIKAGMQGACGGRAGMKLIKPAFELFMIHAPAVPGTVDLFAPNPFAANFKNGTLWLIRDEETFDFRLEFKAHRREDFLVNVLPYSYDPEDKSENMAFLEMLTRIFDGDSDQADKTRAVAQMYGACLMPAFPRLFLLWGDPLTGKSTLVNLTAKLMNAENIGSVPPNDMKGFNLESLAGKLVNVDPEIPTRDPIDDDVVKKIIDRKPFRIRRKGIKDIYAPIPAVHVFGGNKIPPSYEASTAHERRWTFIHCKNVIQQQKPRLDYGDYVYGRNPQGLLNFALMGLRDLVANGGHFVSPASSKEKMEKWHREANPIAQFIHAIESGEEITPNTKLLIHPEARVKTTQLWDNFQAWAQASDLRISWLGKYKFYEAIEQRGFGRVTIDGNQHFSGIGVLAAEGSQF